MSSIIKCGNGHFYDADKDKECPYCKNREAKGIERIRIKDGIPGAAAEPDDLEDRPTEAFLGDPDPGNVILRGPGSRTGMPVRGIGADRGDVTIGIFSPETGKGYITGWLVGRSGLVKGKDYKIFTGHNWVGKSFNSAISIRDVAGIREEKHCDVVYDNRSNRFFIAPGRGSNTYLNGETLTDPRPLAAGDRVRIGEGEFDFVPYCTEGHTWEEDT